MQSCIACGRGFHKECMVGCKSCHPKEEKVEVLKETKASKTVEYKKRGKTAAGLKDPKSTGRKRAAILYPLNEELPCEWQSLKNCGGGRFPIVGCTNGLQSHRHHGPVKDTTRNHEGNVHRICKRCHNHWHELNDLVYEIAAYSLLPHDPMPATPEELVKDELDWRTGEMGKRFKLASSENHSKKYVD